MEWRRILGSRDVGIRMTQHRNSWARTVVRGWFSSRAVVPTVVMMRSVQEVRSTLRIDQDSDLYRILTEDTAQAGLSRE